MAFKMNPMEQYFIHTVKTNKYARHNQNEEKETRRKMCLLKMIYVAIIITGMHLAITFNISMTIKCYLLPNEGHFNNTSY